MLFSLPSFAAEFRALTEAGTVRVPLQGNVKLACEIRGYFPPDVLPQITWQVGNENVEDLNSTLYRVSTGPGSGFIQNGGDNVIASVVSELAIIAEDSSVFETTFLCQSSVGSPKVFTLLERELEPSPSELFPLYTGAIF